MAHQNAANDCVVQLYLHAKGPRFGHIPALSAQNKGNTSAQPAHTQCVYTRKHDYNVSSLKNQTTCGIDGNKIQDEPHENTRKSQQPVHQFCTKRRCESIELRDRSDGDNHGFSFLHSLLPQNCIHFELTSALGIRVFEPCLQGVVVHRRPRDMAG